jgi:glycerophosphoryl diester phosphodiesterase
MHNPTKSTKNIKMNKSIAANLRLACVSLSCLMFLSSNVLADCKGMVLHAHRGDPNLPENSGRAIQSSLQGNWDGVEIDIQQLRDRAWVIQHDPVLGRTTSLALKRVQDLDSAMWQEIRLKDRKGNVTKEAAPFLKEMLIQAFDYPDKIINAEIKQAFWGCDVAHNAVAEFNSARPNGNWFLTSIERGHLKCARQVDPQGYLGLIVLDKQALARKDSRTAKHADKLAPPKIDRAWLQNLLREVSLPVGIHIDTNTLDANSNLLSEAKALGIAVFTYNLMGDREHLRDLRTVRQRSGMWPSGAIIDGTSNAFCGELMRN